MRGLFRNKSNNIFICGQILVVFVFFYVRPLDSPWHPFIAGDGLGYYSYLPAKFIHNDPDLDFKWFNKVYNTNYVYSTFENPEDNLLVEYKGKKINKYYQGLSYIWMPFFIAAHIYAKLFHYVPDGFSKPYQLFMGLASLVYLLGGLYFLRKLLSGLFKNQVVAALVPFLFLLGTHLYTYAIFANTLSHSYSFSFTSAFLYFTWRFFNEPRKKLQSLLLCILLLILSACIRPMNILIVLVVPAFLPAGFLKSRLVIEKLRIDHVLILLLSFGAIFYQLWLTKIQTGSVFAYTYTDEEFRFHDARFFDALFSYHMGLFVYVPLIFVSLFGSFFTKRKLALILAGFFFGMIFLYSAWWYWPITKRAIIDFYAIPAIFLTALLTHMQKSGTKYLLGGLCGIAVVYFQFKNLQVNRGILDEYLTYKEIFWRNFFRTTKANMFFVPPQSVIEEIKFSEDFEGLSQFNRTSLQKRTGSFSLLLDSAHYMSEVIAKPLPVFKKTGRKKIRIAFDTYIEAGIPTVHVFFRFYDRQNNLIVEIPYYINEDFIQAASWDHKEFGYDMVDEKTLHPDSIGKVTCAIWNVTANKRVFIDDVQFSFLLTDNSFETVK